MTAGTEAGSEAMRKTVHWHIGLHKTGTTFIQRSLIANRDLLEDRGFDLAPMHDRHGRHYELVEALRAGRFAEVFEGIRKVPTPNVIVTAEGLSTDLMHRDRAEALRAESVRRNLGWKMHIWLRRQDFLYESVYVQGQKEARSILAAYANPIAYDFLARLDILESVFGRESVMLEIYDDFSRSDIFGKFLRRLGVAASDFRSVNPMNVSPTRRESLFMSGLREDDPALNAFVYNILRKFGRVADDGMKFLTSPELRNALVQRHAAGNAELLRRYRVNDLDWFATPPGMDSSWTPPAPVTLAERLAVWRDCARALRGRRGRFGRRTTSVRLFLKMILLYREPEMRRAS